MSGPDSQEQGKTSEYTPGPWTVEPGGFGLLNIVGRDGKAVALPIGIPARSPEVEMANARLIAAAPLGLKACKQALAELKRLEDVVDACENWVQDEPMDLCRQFIAQAEGGGR